MLLFRLCCVPADDYELLCRLDETVENHKGAAASTIDALPTQTVPAGGLAGAAPGERLSCAVCLEEFNEGAELRTLPCLHRFHKVSRVADGLLAGNGPGAHQHVSNMLCLSAVLLALPCVLSGSKQTANMYMLFRIWTALLRY